MRENGGEEDKDAEIMSENLIFGLWLLGIMDGEWV